MTSLSGILMLVIILIVLDTKKTKVLIPTPMERDPTKEPVYVECDISGRIAHVDVKSLDAMARKKLDEIANQAGGDRNKMLNLLASATVENETYRVNLMSKAMKVLEISRKPDAVMQDVPDVSSSIDNKAQIDWFMQFISGINTNKQYVVFIVRSSDKSFESFKRARAHAWLKNINVAYEIFDNAETIRMSEAGQFPRAQ
jgi:biopolymer transport protein ExbD